MVFSSLFFVLLFLPVNLLCYAFAKTIQTKNRVMLIFSLIFYAWGEPVYVLLLIAVSFVNWALALGIGKSEDSSRRKWLLVAASAVSLFSIGVFKYAGFFLSQVKALTGFPAVVPSIALPIGISFYTFQILSYVVDVYRREVPYQPQFSKFLLYVSMFHQCVAGPIVRYQDVAAEITERKVSLPELGRGITRFTVGLGKKALLANTCSLIADALLLSADTMAQPGAAAAMASRPAFSLWLGMLAFMLFIYLDFSAYSDMAIGMGLMIGFHYKENFNYPYLSRSVSEFWRRWHMSLGSFFRDYVYIPLGVSRKGTGRTVFNLLVVWGLTGLWHGASWNFVLWGLYFFVFIALEKLTLGKRLSRHPALSRVYLLAVVYFGWILFHFTDLGLMGLLLKGMLGLNGNGFIDFEGRTTLLNYLFFLIAALVSVTPLVKRMGAVLRRAGQTSVLAGGIYNVVNVGAPPVLLILSVLALAGNSYNPFLYFQF